MRRFSLALALAAALLLMLTAIATAAPPNCEELPFEHPHYCGLPCDELDPSDPNWCETPPTTTTTTTEPSTLDACPTGTFPIEVPRPGPVNYECLWTPEDPMAEPGVGVEGIVKVASLDGISSLVVFVRDDSPGDICLLTQGAEGQLEPDGSFVGSFDLAYGSMEEIVAGAGWDPEDYPEDYPEDERPPSFDPYVSQTYWTFHGAHWCYPQDGVAGMREDLNGPALHLWIRFRANPKVTSAVLVTLTTAQQEAGL